MTEEAAGEVRVDSGQEDDAVDLLSLVHFLNPSVGDLEELVVLKTSVSAYSPIRLELVAVRASEVRLGSQWRGRRESSSFSFRLRMHSNQKKTPASRGAQC